MRALLQRVTQASVVVEGLVVSKINAGLLILLGVAKPDTVADAAVLVEKVLNLRIFRDAEGKMNRSLLDTRGSLLVVSQFTLYGDCRKGRRPGFDAAAPAEQARALYESFVEIARRSGLQVETGVFQAHMEVGLINDGPVTLMLETNEGKA
ncbi:MAG TPA: D-aminoacyl-tRNA deacylase [Bryobacteraceae bacterium]|jgi:D-tyrosyl-tRNA(Tyr) deacylase|nr:D-aminoacyl-tRNA deacylase [Bryobacteraceae bacterium]